MLSGLLLAHFHWGSVLLLTLPLALLALFMAWRFVPAHVNEATDPVDYLAAQTDLGIVKRRRKSREREHLAQRALLLNL